MKISTNVQADSLATNQTVARSLKLKSFLLNALISSLLLFTTSLALAPAARADWPMYNHDVQGSRYNDKEHKLGPANAGQLAAQWSFTTPAPVTSTPAVTGCRVYAGDFSGRFYALDAQTGGQHWQTQVAGPISGSALVDKNRVIFGDLAGFVYGLDKDTGAIAWQVKPNSHPWAAIYGSATPVGKYVAIGISSNEWFAPAAVPGYPCCTFRGSVALLDPKDGHIVWQTYFITPAESANGSSGAPIWSTPTYDKDLGLIFVTTGNNYTDPATGLSDSIIALNANTGAIVWANQRYANDSWNVLFPPFPPHPDYDIGDSAQIYRLPNGRKVVGAGQKSGFYHVLDAITGQEVNQRQFEVAGSNALGGLFADSAVVDGIVYANGGNYPFFGDVIAFDGGATHELWRFNTPGGANLSGVAVANGVVYFSSMDGKLYALRAADGAPLAQLALGAHTSGPSISKGRVFLGTGDSISHFFFGVPTPGSIVALGVPGQAAACENDD
jgi:polyvinyl alcohol dehydrogenase (cytochrome)